MLTNHLSLPLSNSIHNVQMMSDVHSDAKSTSAPPLPPLASCCSPLVVVVADGPSVALGPLGPSPVAAAADWGPSVAPLGPFVVPLPCDSPLGLPPATGTSSMHLKNPLPEKREKEIKEHKVPPENEREIGMQKESPHVCIPSSSGSIQPCEEDKDSTRTNTKADMEGQGPSKRLAEKSLLSAHSSTSALGQSSPEAESSASASDALRHGSASSIAHQNQLSVQLSSKMQKSSLASASLAYAESGPSRHAEGRPRQDFPSYAHGTFLTKYNHIKQSIAIKTIQDLRKTCKQHNISQQGRKHEIVARIVNKLCPPPQTDSNPSSS